LTRLMFSPPAAGRGGAELLEHPSFVFRKESRRPPSAKHPPRALKLGRGRSSTLTGSPPANGMMATFLAAFGWSSRYRQAIKLPSGDTIGGAVNMNLSVSRKGSPPSIETFQSLVDPARAEGKTTQRLSGEERAMKSPGPSVSCLRLPPSGSMRQMVLAPRVRVELKTM